MENASKALVIAGGVLIAVVIMSLIAYFFSSISEWPQEQDDEQSAEQLAKFNLEYEVYEKSAMYGTDVISCLNKANSNNEKYVDPDSEENSGGWLSGNKYGNEFTVNVYVKINSELQESLEVYYFNEKKNGNGSTGTSTDEDDPGKPEKKFNQEDIKNKGDGESINIRDVNLMDDSESTYKKNERTTYYSVFASNSGVGTAGVTDINDLYTKTITLNSGTNHLERDKYYSLNDSQLKSLINLSKLDLKVTKKNTNGNLRQWSTVIWKTALYDFKTRRFSCDEIHYNDITGRIDEIKFSEM